MNYRFGPFELQSDQRRLLKDGAMVDLRPRAFDLLVALVDRAGELVTKDELLERVWPKVVVEEAALHVQVSSVRKVIGAKAITTVSGRGYQFTLPVTTVADPADGAQASPSKHNLPYPLTSFVGREHETAQLRELVGTNRLVTLTGTGGAGKTRLAIEVASRLVDAFPDGVFLVELAALSDGRLIAQAVAEALEVKVKSTQSVMEALAEHLHSKHLLLVLDNVEHLLEGCARFVDDVLRRSASVAIFVTSREHLAIGGELTYRVPSLTVPGPSASLSPAAALTYEGVRLFADRARLSLAGFEVTPENAARVASICHRLDGIPLAIELAAPRLRSMSIDELSEGLGQRFDLLTGGSRTALARHRTLRSTIDWSYELLTEIEQAMLRRVSVFVDGWTLAAAEHACTDDLIGKPEVLGLLTSLVDKHLVIADEHKGTTRYRMLETVRQYALERLHDSGEEQQWRQRQFAWALALVEESFEPVNGPDQASWLDRLARELDNFRAALAWAIDHKVADAFRMAPGISRWWVRRATLAEAKEWFTRLLDAIPKDQAKRDRARALSAVGNLARDQRDHDEAERLFRESIELFREVHETRGAAYVQTNLALLTADRARFADAQRLLQESATLARTLGDVHLVAVNLGTLAEVMHERGDSEASASLFAESLVLAREAGNPFLASEILTAKGRAECRDGKLEAAESSLIESIAIGEELSDPHAVMQALEGFAELALARRAMRRAATMLGVARHLRDDIGSSLSSWEEARLARVDAAARVTLGDVVFDQAWGEGTVMNLHEAVRYALDD